jgi:zinc transport system ATP-binding protein
VTAIATDQLCVRLSGTTVLQDISIDIPEGSYAAIVGPNGSGKTTLLRTMLGLVPVDTGTVTLLGQDIRRFNQFSRIGYLPQASQIHPHFPASAAEVVASGLLGGKRLPKFITRADRKSVTRAMELVNIASQADRPIGRLSGGQQQRTLLARAMVAEPDLLFLDEPTASLDPETRDGFYQTVDELNRRRGVTVVLVTHDTATVGRFASRLIYLDRRVVFAGSFEDFCNSQEMTEYFGHHAQHIICHRHNETHG